jgi:hypothetical protein
LTSKAVLYAGAAGERYDPEVHGKRVGQMGMLEDAEKVVCFGHEVQLRMLPY